MSERKEKWQSVFDCAWGAYVLQSKGPGYDFFNSRCMYVTPDGCRCAIGVLYADVPHPFGNRAVGVHDLMGTREIAEPFDMGDAEFLTDLQSTHDLTAKKSDPYYHGPHEPFGVRISRGLRAFAERHKLDCPQPA